MNGNAQKLSPASPDPDWIDPDDADEIDAEWVATADLYHGERLVRRGRPRAETPRPMVSLRMDPDLLAHLRASGKGWQTRVNALLCEAMDQGRL